MESLQQFYNETIGKSFGNYNGGFVGECVSGGQQFLMRVFGLALGAWGNAIDYSPVHTSADQYLGLSTPQKMRDAGFEWHTDQAFRDGDLLIWGNDPGTMTGPLGHMGYWYGGKVISQNYNGNRNFTAAPFWSAGFRGYWRKTGWTSVVVPVTVDEASYHVDAPLAGYVNASDASNHANSNSSVPAGDYHIFNQSNGMINVTAKAGEPGWWINPADAHVSQPAPAPEPAAPDFAVGNVVAPNAVDTHDYDGTVVHAWAPNYVITELIGDRAVLNVPGDGIWAAMHLADIHRV